MAICASGKKLLQEATWGYWGYAVGGYTGSLKIYNQGYKANITVE